MPPTSGPIRSSHMLASYKRAKMNRRVMLVIFSAIFIATLGWAIPWLPYGLAVEDYSDRLTMMMLLLGATVSAFGAMYMRDVSRRVEQTLVTWTSVHEGLGDMRRREYFYERIVLECERAENTQREFSVIVLRIQDAAEGDEMENIIAAFEPKVHEYDCICQLGPHEIGVLAPKVSREQVKLVADNLASMLATAAGREAYVITSWSVFPTDAREAGALVGIARERIAVHLPANAA